MTVVFSSDDLILRTKDIRLCGKEQIDKIERDITQIVTDENQDGRYLKSGINHTNGYSILGLNADYQINPSNELFAQAKKNIDEFLNNYKKNERNWVKACLGSIASKFEKEKTKSLF